MFPGLEIVTTALAHLSGLSLFASGVFVLGASRIVLVLSLYLAIERVTRSARIAGIACLIYLSNPKVLFFDAQFSYESLGLPLAALALVTIVYRAHAVSDDRNRAALTVVALLSLSALVVTHHLTSYAFVIFLLWSLIQGIATWRQGGENFSSPWILALAGLVMTAGWAVWVAPSVKEYLLPHLEDGLHQLSGILSGSSSGRTLFRDNAGQVAPPWERLAQLAATVLIVVGIPFGLVATWRRYRGNVIALTLAAVSFAYLLSLPFRLTTAGAEASDRAAGFSFIGVGFVLAICVTGLGPFATFSHLKTALLTCLGTVIFVGEIIVGSGPAWSRLPGPYLVSADNRSIDNQSLGAERWMLAALGPGNRVATDRANGLLLGSYGHQIPVAHVNTGLDIASFSALDSAVCSARSSSRATSATCLSIIATVPDCRLKASISTRRSRAL